MGIKVAILCFNNNLSYRVLQEIVKNDVLSKPIKVMKDQVLMEDGTRYIIIPSSPFRGIRLDQLIIVDDSRWMILDECEEFINYCIKPCLANSNVPDDFLIQKYEI